MGEQGRRLLLAVALALGVMMLWNVIFPGKKEDPKPKPVPGQVDPGAPVKPTSAAGVALTTTEMPAEAPWGADDAAPITLRFADEVVRFTSRGGAIASWQLTDARYAADRSHGELIPQQEGAGSIQVNFANSTYVLPRHAMWTGEKLSDTQVRFRYHDSHFELIKTYTVDPAAYVVKVAIEVGVKSKAEARQLLTVSTFGFQDPKDSGGGGRSVSARIWESATVRGGTRLQTDYKDVLAWPRAEQNVRWTGFEHPFLLAGIAPRPGTDAAPLSYEKHTYAIEAVPGLMQTDLYFPTQTFAPNAPPVTYQLVGYFGPKNYDELAGADDAAGYDTGFNKTVDLGMFRFIGKPLLWLMKKLFALTHNWGIAIILLTLLVKLATLYWTTKSMRSMKAMAALAPKMKELQEKYKDDKARQQQEVMALYKTHGVSPLAGCLPILLQMPIWLALYRMLSNAGELYLQPFIPGWIDDLTNTDPFHILPVLVTVTMFLQSRMQPATGDQMQQKIMMYMMPLLFGFMGFFFPAGLSLYIFTNTCLSALHSLYMKKYDKVGGTVQSMASAKAEVTATAARQDAAKAVIDAESTEKRDGDDGDDGDDAPASNGAVGATKGSKAKRKGRRR